MVFRSVLGIPVPTGGEGEGGGASTEFKVGTAGVEFALVPLGVGRPETVADREGMAVFLVVVVGRWDAVEVRLESGGVASSSSAACLRFLGTGRAGRGPVGGGRGVRGRAEVMIEVEVPDIASWRGSSALSRTTQCPRLLAAGVTGG